MALVNTIEKIQKTSQRVHGPVECSYSVFSEGGKRYLQLDTYGSSDRAQPGKVSQALQFDRKSAERLLQLIHEAFPDLAG
jgi:hypothetical protein